MAVVLGRWVEVAMGKSEKEVRVKVMDLVHPVVKKGALFF